MSLNKVLVEKYPQKIKESKLIDVLAEIDQDMNIEDYLNKLMNN